LKNLSGRVALVTGGGRGLREATAIQLSDAGAAVALMSHSSRSIVEEARAIEHTGGRALAIAVDMTNPVDLANACDEISQELGKIDILINTESAIGPLGAFVEINIEEWMYALMANLQEPVRLTRLLLPDMLESGWGRIVNISTGALNFPTRGDSFNGYLASKAGLETHTINLALQLAGTGVTANVMRSGSMQVVVDGGDPEKVGEAFYQRFTQRRSKNQLPSPEERAMSLLDLVSGDLNGEILNCEPFV
jgi:3-oxoacyl-[acyl-carrier protein] reductase